jgi:hypothetical protein
MALFQFILAAVVVAAVLVLLVVLVVLQLKSYWPRQRVVQPAIAAIADVHVALPGTSIRSGAMCHFLRLEKYFSVYFHLSVKFRVSTTRNSCQHQSNSVSAPLNIVSAPLNIVSAPVNFRVSTTQYRVSTSRIRVSTTRTRVSTTQIRVSTTQACLGTLSSLSRHPLKPVSVPSQACLGTLSSLSRHPLKPVSAPSQACLKKLSLRGDAVVVAEQEWPSHPVSKKIGEAFAAVGGGAPVVFPPG